MTGAGVHFLNITLLSLLWLVPAILLLFFYEQQRRKRSLETFADSRILPRLNAYLLPARRRWKRVLLILATVFLILALARPGWNPQTQTIERRGRDVVFLVDVSRSMLAEDLKPNRMKRAQFAILDTVERLAGDRVALVAFAGTAVVKCPLTLDYGFFHMMVENLGPASVSRGGTMIGDALRKVLDEVLDDRERRFKDVVLITDGEDHDSFPVEAAQRAGEAGIRIIAVGLGDEEEGQRIPVTGDDGRQTFLTYEGQEIWSRLDAETLRRMAQATPGGAYFNVSSGTIDLADIYIKLIQGAEGRSVTSETVQRYEEKYQVFLVAAFALLFVESLLSERKRGLRTGISGGIRRFLARVKP